MAQFVGGSADGRDMADVDGLGGVKVTVLYADACWSDEWYARGEDGRFHFCGVVSTGGVVDGRFYCDEPPLIVPISND